MNFFAISASGLAVRRAAPRTENSRLIRERCFITTGQVDIFLCFPCLLSGVFFAFLVYLEAYGPQADLGVAFPVMIQNLSNFSGLLRAPNTDNENITHHFGHLKDIMGRTDDLRLKSQCYMLIFWTCSCNPNETTSVGSADGMTHIVLTTVHLILQSPKSQPRGRQPEKYDSFRLQDDEAMLHDKFSGFFTVLHAAMDGKDGPTYCPRYSMKHIKDWLHVSAIAVVSS